MSIPGQQVINVGLPNEPTNSDSLYTAFTKANVNFTTLFNSASPYNTFTANTGIFTGNGSGLSAIAGANVTGAVSFATTANAVAGANVSGQVGNALVSGTVYTAAQPNITSVGTLTSLGVTGNLTSGNANLGNLVTANYFAGDGSQLVNIPIGTTLSNGTSSINIPAANGNINITRGGTANVVVITGTGVNVTGNITSGNATLGNAAIANYFIGDGSQLTGIVATGQGIVVTNNNLNIGVTSSLNFGQGITVSPVSAGVVTITTVYAPVAGIATYSQIAGIATYATNAGISTYATNSGISTNLNAGTIYQIPYQSAPNTTAFISTTSVVQGYLLQYNNNSAPSWVSQK